MQPGDVVRLSSVRCVGVDGSSWEEHRPNDKTRLFVAVMLGTEPKVITDPKQELDIIATMKAHGWQRIPEPQPKQPPKREVDYAGLRKHVHRNQR